MVYGSCHSCQSVRVYELIRFIWAIFLLAKRKVVTLLVEGRLKSMGKGMDSSCAHRACE